MKILRTSQRVLSPAVGPKPNDPLGEEVVQLSFWNCLQDHREYEAPAELDE